MGTLDSDLMTPPCSELDLDEFINYFLTTLPWKFSLRLSPDTLPAPYGPAYLGFPDCLAFPINVNGTKRPDL